MSSSTARPAAASACFTRAATSGMADSGDAVERQEERVPDAALLREHLPARSGEAVVAAAALPGALDPAPVDQPLVFEAVEGRVERRGMERDRAAGTLVDEAADVVPVPLPLVEQRQDQDLGAAALKLPLEERRAHMW